MIMKGVYAIIILSLLSISVFAQDHHVGPVTDIAVAGKQVYSVSQGGVYRGSPDTLERLYEAPFRITSIAVIAGTGSTADHLLIAGGEPGVSGIVGILDTDTRQFHSFNVSKDLIYDVAVHPDGHLAALACADHRVLTVQLSTFSGASLQTRHQHTAPVRAVAFSPDGKYMASGGLDALVILSRVTEPAKLTQMQEHSSKIDCLVFSPDSQFIASGARDGKVRIHSTEGRLQRSYTGLSEEVATQVWGSNSFIWALAWGGKEPTLIAGASKGTLYHLSPIDNRWKELPDYADKPIYSLAFSNHGEFFLGTHGRMSIFKPSPFSP